MEFAQYIIPAVAGLVSGAIGSLVAPWVQWGIESHRNRNAGRKELLAEVRAVLSKPPVLAEFRQLPIYSRVLPILSPETRAILEGEFDKWGNESVMLVSGPHGGVDPYAHHVLTELAAKEQEWGLV